MLEELFVRKYLSANVTLRRKNFPSKTASLDGITKHAKLEITSHLLTSKPRRTDSRAKCDVTPERPLGSFHHFWKVTLFLSDICLKITFVYRNSQLNEIFLISMFWCNSWEYKQLKEEHEKKRIYISRKENCFLHCLLKSIRDLKTRQLCNHPVLLVLKPYERSFCWVWPIESNRFTNIYSKICRNSIGRSTGGIISVAE